MLSLAHPARRGRARRALRPGFDTMEGRALMTAGPVTFEATVGNAGFDGYYKSAVTMNFLGYEPGVTNTIQTFYKVNNGPLLPGNTVTITTSGFYNVTYVAVDPTGHVGQVFNKVVCIDDATPSLTAVADTTTLWPPNGQVVPVTVAGHVGDNLSGNVPYVFFDVYDTDGQVHPFGVAPVDANGNYDFTVDLIASRAGQDKYGRVYAISVVAADYAGNVSEATTYVIVPHDMGHGPGGPGNQGDDGGDGAGTKPGHGHG